MFGAKLIWTWKRCPIAAPSFWTTSCSWLRDRRNLNWWTNSTHLWPNHKVQKNPLVSSFALWDATRNFPKVRRLALLKNEMWIHKISKKMRVFFFWGGSNLSPGDTRVPNFSLVCAAKSCQICSQGQKLYVMWPRRSLRNVFCNFDWAIFKWAPIPECVNLPL